MINTFLETNPISLCFKLLNISSIVKLISCSQYKYNSSYITSLLLLVFNIFFLIISIVSSKKIVDWLLIILIFLSVTSSNSSVSNISSFALVLALALALFIPLKTSILFILLYSKWYNLNISCEI